MTTREKNRMKKQRHAIAKHSRFTTAESRMDDIERYKIRPNTFVKLADENPTIYDAVWDGATETKKYREAMTYPKRHRPTTK